MNTLILVLLFILTLLIGLALGVSFTSEKYTMQVTGLFDFMKEKHMINEEEYTEFIDKYIYGVHKLKRVVERIKRFKKKLWRK